jgi:hypothetical protein
MVAIGSNSTTLTLEDVVASLLSKKMRQENMEGSTKDVSMLRFQPFERG